MAGRVQCRYGQGKMYILASLGGVDPENFPVVGSLGGFYLFVPRLIFYNFSKLI